jgi:SAM-dependent methyltransferase
MAYIAQDLDYSMFSIQDVKNLCLQRTNRLSQLPDVRTLDENSLSYPEQRLQIMQAIFEEIEDNFLVIKDVFARVHPKSIADIGCGYAFMDLLVYRQLKCKLLLIDIEETDEVYFMYKEKGAGYSNLNVARQFLEANGVPADDIVTINPDNEDLQKTQNVDLAMSLLSCGFHYPAATYKTYFEDRVNSAVLLDVRRSTNNRKVLELLGPTRIVHADGKYDCIVSRKW